MRIMDYKSPERLPGVRLQKEPKICHRLDGVGTLCYLLECVDRKLPGRLYHFLKVRKVVV